MNRYVKLMSLIEEATEIAEAMSNDVALASKMTVENNYNVVFNHLEAAKKLIRQARNAHSAIY